MQNIEGKQERIYKKGETLFKQGDPAEEMYIVQSGQVVVYRTDEKGVRFDLGTYAKGAILGEIALFDNSPRFGTAEVVTDARVVFVNKPQFQKQLEKMPAWLATIVNIIVKRLRTTSRRMQDAVARDHSVTVARMLVLLAAAHHDRIAGEDVIRIDDANREIIELTGMDPDTLAKTYELLVSKKLLRMEKGKIILANPELMDKFIRYKKGQLAGNRKLSLSGGALKVLNALVFYAEKKAEGRAGKVELQMGEFAVEFEKMSGEPVADEFLRELYKANLIEFMREGRVVSITADLAAKTVVLEKNKVQELLEFQNMVHLFEQ